MKRSTDRFTEKSEEDMKPKNGDWNRSLNMIIMMHLMVSGLIDNCQQFTNTSFIQLCIFKRGFFEYPSQQALCRDIGLLIHVFSFYFKSICLESILISTFLNAPLSSPFWGLQSLSALPSPFGDVSKSELVILSQWSQCFIYGGSEA